MSQAAAPTTNKIRFYDFGPFRVDSLNRLLLRDGQIVPLTSKVFDILVIFVSNSGRMFDKEELMKQVWPGSFVEEGNLTRNVSTLRKALGESPQEHHYIVTVPGRGYRFVAAVVEVPDGGADLLIQEFTRAQVTIEDTHTHPKILQTIGKVLAVRPATPSFSKSAVVVLVGAISVVSAALFIWLNRRSGRETTLARPKITKLTNLGNCYDATVSPDGKFLVFILSDGGRQSLWVRQVATASDQQLIPPEEVRYFGVTFSLDGNYIYYVVAHSEPSETNVQHAALFRMALLGGPSVKINEDLDSAISFSPDGSRYTYTREYTNEGESAVMTASLEGSEETKLASRRLPEYFDFPSWSPEGKSIACVATSFRGPNQIVLFSADGRTEAKQLSSSKSWGLIMKLLWTKDGTGIFVDARDPLVGSGLQIWRVAYPSGEVQRITNDNNSYVRLSATANSDTLVGVESTMIYSMWISETDQSGLETELVSNLEAYSGMAWMADGRIVYAASNGVNPQLWVMKSDGSDRKQLTALNYGAQNPAVSPDGRYIYFTVYRTDSEDIWRLENAGLDQTPITKGNHAFSLACTPDGKWIVFTSRGLDRWSTLWKISTEGGAITELNHNLVRSPVVSPDGKLVACFYIDSQENTQTKQPSIALIPVAGGPPTKIIKTSTTVNFPAGLQWSTDGTTITYADNRSGFSNIWGQSLAGKTPRQLTNFKGEQIFAFAWSRDGSRLAFLRRIEKTYAVVLTNLNSSMIAGR